ncbi:MAG: hypothetical protein LJE67_10165, partial [Salaquimonas sp.]|nr:hypothetical protein [Salaquimonas sp.]
MQQTIEKAVLKFDWGIPASVGAHALVLALLVFGLPQFHHTPDEPKAIDVALVPPPEPVKPAESKPEEKKVEEKKPQEKKVEEKKPEEKKPEERQTEP